MPRPKKNGVSKKNGALKDKLTENDRLTMLVAHERNARCAAQVEASQAKAIVVAGLLEKAQLELVEANKQLRESHKKIQKTYGTDDNTAYNFETGAIVRQEKDVATPSA